MIVEVVKARAAPIKKRNHRCELQPCDIRVDDGKDERKTIPRILDRPEFNECPIQRDVIP
jgi:hypothetical protein